ncbi:MAG: hypothetical protein WAN65_07630 [Candidatus Sulfotelmatobacter sp.]
MRTAAESMEATQGVPSTTAAVSSEQVPKAAQVVAAPATPKSFVAKITPFVILLLLAAAGGAWWLNNRPVQDRKNEVSALASMRVLIMSEAMYSHAYPSKGFAASLDKLGPATGTADENHADFINADLAKGTKVGYQFAVSIPEGNSTGGTNLNYFIVVKPLAGHTGHTFCADSTGTIHYASREQECTMTSSTIPNPVSCSPFAHCVVEQINTAEEWQRSHP